MKNRISGYNGELVQTEEEQAETDERSKDIQRRAAEIAAVQSAKKSAYEVMKKYEKPDTYTGNRTLYDSGKAKRDVKIKSFQENEVVKDQYTGAKLELRKADAKAKYNDKWAEHLAESDHINPLEKIHDKYKNSAWVSTKDIETVANSEENMQIVSRKFNNAKRSRTQKELVQDEKYLKKTGLELSEGAKRKAIEVGDKAEKNIRRNLAKIKVNNVITEGHTAGIQSAKSASGTAAAVSLASNTVSVVKGDKGAGEAVVDVAVDVSKAAAVGYWNGAEITVLTNTLAHSPSKFLSTLAKHNVIGEITVGVMATGKSLVRYLNDEISIREMAEEVAVTGVEIIAGAVGAACCGGPLGAVVAGMLASAACNIVISVKEKLVSDEKKYKYQLGVMSRIENEVLQEIQYQRTRLEDIINKEFQGWNKDFEEGFNMMMQSAVNNDFSGLADGIDTIMSLFQSEAAFHNVEEVEEFWFDDSTVFEF